MEPTKYSFGSDGFPWFSVSFEAIFSFHMLDVYIVFIHNPRNVVSKDFSSNPEVVQYTWISGGMISCDWLDVVKSRNAHFLIACGWFLLLYARLFPFGNAIFKGDTWALFVWIQLYGYRYYIVFFSWGGVERGIPKIPLQDIPNTTSLSVVLP